MKKKYMAFCMAALIAAMSLSACTDIGQDSAPSLGYGRLEKVKISVSASSFTGQPVYTKVSGEGQHPSPAIGSGPVPVGGNISVSATCGCTGEDWQPSGTKALKPMGPEMENSMQSIAVFQFDAEGNLLNVNPDDPKYSRFHYMDLTSGENPSGQISTTLDVSLVTDNNHDTKVCLLANVPKEEVDRLLYNSTGDRYKLWSEFLMQTISIPYMMEKDTPDDSIGHVRRIYMFGYYDGVLKSESDSESGSGSLSVVMGRIIAKLRMDIRLAETVSIPDDHRLFLSLFGVEKEAYLFPGSVEINPVHDHIDMIPVDRTKMINKGSGLFYYYVAPHVVFDRRNATSLVLWCVPSEVTAEELYEDMREGLQKASKADRDLLPKDCEYPFYRALMCNDPLGENPSVEGAYWLNRNSVYHINLTLTYTSGEGH